MMGPKNKNKSLTLQSGAALLVLMLIIITGASFMLINKLNVNLIHSENIEETYRSLERAKQALIGYALTVPERSTASPRPGPGYLPCPDIDNDGDAELVCGGGGLPAVGRIPYETLEEDVLRDDSGQVFWYALSPNYRNIGARFTPLNSETAGQLTLDGQGDVVAVIIAPGSAYNNQQRSIGPNAVINYLENDNSDGDASFISYLVNDNPPTFNDKVIAITRQELMSNVEKRVLGLVSSSLEGFRNSFAAGNEAYPWLAPLNDPSISNYLWTVNTFFGHLSLHISGQNYVNVAAFTATWNTLAGGAYIPSGVGIAPLEDCLRNSSCNSQNGPLDVTPLINNATCVWVNRLSFNCTTTVNDIWPGVLPGVNRTYTLVYTDNSANAGTVPALSLTAPSAALPRTRGITINGAFRGQVSITATDTGAQTGSATLLIPVPGNSGNISLAGMDYHIDTVGVDLNGDGDVTDAGEQADFPDWFLTNNWHHQILVAYPSNGVEPLPGVSPPSPICAPPNCLTLTSNNGTNLINNNIRAITVISGQDITPASPRPNALGAPPATLTDYFDLINSNGNSNTFDQQLFSPLFNDQLRIIRTTLTNPP